MVKKAILLMSAAALLGSAANAQLTCGSDEAYHRYKAAHPEVAMYEQQLKAEIEQNLKRGNLNKFARTTYVNEDTVYDVSLVFHIVHDYNGTTSAEYLPDSVIYGLVADINRAYSKTNTAQLNDVIPTYKGKIPGTTKDYIGNVNIRFHLATKDPSGKPTHGITRHRSYKTYNGGDDAKFDQWAPSAYMNVWFVRTFSGDHTGAAAYAYQPPTAAANPYIDGVISLASYAQQDNTIAHELGHCLNLDHPWGNTNNPAIACGDDDVEDTPPTKGHSPQGCVAGALYDTVCANGYAKNYSYNQFLDLYDTSWAVAPPKIWEDSNHTVFHYDSTAMFLVNYPDTTNAQNIMDYTYCSKMFTYGQGQRMRAALKSSTGNRNRLYNDTTLAATGALAPWQDLAPIADFSLGRISGSITDKVPADKVFGCADDYTFSFVNRSWNDTVESVAWTFSNGATNPTATTFNVTNKFSEPGWVTVGLTATGNGNSGSGTVTRQAVYVADKNATNPDNYVEEFTSMDKYPSFNYFDNKFKWSSSTFGTYDNSGVVYNNFDTRVYIYTTELTGTPQGDYDDLFTPAFDLSDPKYAANCNLNFMSAGATRTTIAADMKDTLEIWYSTDCANSWKLMSTLSKGQLHTNGTRSTSFAPTWPGDWSLQSLDIPTLAKSSKTFFRFRYKPGTATNGVGSGNNFYMDRLQITNYGTGVNATTLDKEGVTLAPNPTTGASNLYIKGGNGLAQVRVTDITGKVVFSTQQQLNGNVTMVEIPAAAVSVKGMYLVQVVSNNRTNTEKLVVY